MSIALAVDAVRRGGIIAYPAEAVFGLGCNPDDTDAIKRLLQLKGRDPNKGLIIVASHPSQLDAWMAPLPAHRKKRLLASWPGPVTWIVPARAGLPDLLTGQRSTLAVRVSAHPVIQQLCHTLDHPLVSTSANRSGSTPLRDAASVRRAFGAGVDVVIQAAIGHEAKPTPIFDALTLEQLR